MMIDREDIASSVRCVLCHRDGATFAESFLVMAFADDERGTLPREYVHMTQPSEYWFVTRLSDELADKYRDAFDIDVDGVAGCHAECYLAWLSDNI